MIAGGLDLVDLEHVKLDLVDIEHVEVDHVGLEVAVKLEGDIDG